MDSSRLKSPCGACKVLRRKCTQECPFAPYFPSDSPHMFNNVHSVFGTSNVMKILHGCAIEEREIAVNSLAYDAEWRLRDPSHGCIGQIDILERKLKQVKEELKIAKKELEDELVRFKRNKTDY